MQDGQAAVQSKENCKLYFFDPAQLIRDKMLRTPHGPTFVECPICEGVVMRTDPAHAQPRYTVAGNIVSHFCGDAHRQTLSWMVEVGH